MIPDLVRAVADTRGDATSIAHLADGMSSSAWLATIDDRECVIRVPTDGHDRPPPDYRGESELNAALRAVGVPAAASEAVTVDGCECSIAPLISGDPIQPHQWDPAFTRDVAGALAATHSLAVAGRGLPDAVNRFHLARLWPLDGTELADHPAATRLPDHVTWIASRHRAIEAAAAAPPAVVHTDLHWDHLLRNSAGRLSGLLDFGDAFAGPPGWDLACLRYYHGESAARRVIRHYPDGDRVWQHSHLLGIAFALYKLDKTPDRSDVIDRVTTLLNSAR